MPEESQHRLIVLEANIFAAALLDPELPIPDDVAKTADKPSAKRFSVYRNNVVVGLMDALASAYPSVKAIMGEDNFSRVARVFVSRFPPRSAMMQDFGIGFAEFLAAFEPLKSSPFLADVAACERLWLEAYHAVNEPVLAPEALGAIDPDLLGEAVFNIRSASRLYVSKYPVVDLFAYRYERPQSGVDLSDAQAMLITRPGLDVEVRRIDPVATAFLNPLIDGDPLGNAIQSTMEADADADVSSLVSLLLESGMASAVNVPSRSGASPGASPGEGD